MIRRHPDIRIHRKKTDISKFADHQIDLLTSLWPLLSPGGRMIYITCSILPSENDEVVGQFIRRITDVRITVPPVEAATLTTYGLQLLPKPGESDGLFYAILDRCN